MKFVFFIAGLVVGCVITWAAFQPWRAEQPAKDYYMVGDQKGLPQPQPGEFRITMHDGYRTTKVTEKELNTIANVIGRQKEFHRTPQPISTYGDYLPLPSTNLPSK
jgi:hypothetical protein